MPSSANGTFPADGDCAQPSMPDVNGWAERPLVKLTLPQRGAAHRPLSIPAIQLHRGCGDVTCAVCRSTGTASPLEVPSNTSHWAARRARLARIRRASGAQAASSSPSPVRTIPLDHWIAAQRGRSAAHQLSLPTRTPQTQDDDAAEGVAGAEASHTHAPTAIPGTFSTPSTEGVAALDYPPGGFAGGHSGHISSYADDRPWTNGAGFYITGDAFRALAPIDSMFETFLTTSYIPNAAFALIGGDGRLLMNRAYTNQGALIDYCRVAGLSDYYMGRALRAEIPIATPCSRFRLASIAKSYAAVAMLQLSIDEDVPVNLATPVRDWVPEISDGGHPEWADELTVLHLLCHMTGWDRDHPNDPTMRDVTISRSAFGAGIPITRPQLYDYVSNFYDLVTTGLGTRIMTGYMITPPGVQHVYSNLGYFLVSEIIERVTGVSFQSYVRDNVLAPSGCDATTWGNTAKLAADEMRAWAYYAESPSCTYPAQQQPARARVTTEPVRSTVATDTCAEYPYARPNMEIRYGASAMIAPAQDVARFGWQLSSSASSTLLPSEWIKTMKADWVSALGGSGGPWGLGLQPGLFSTVGVVGHTGSGQGVQTGLAIIDSDYAGRMTNPILDGAVLAILVNTQPVATFWAGSSAYRSLQPFVQAVLSTLNSTSISDAAGLRWRNCQ